MAASDWTYEVEERASREISRLPAGIESLLENPIPSHSTRLGGYENAYRIRFPDVERGPYRVLYAVNRHRRFIRVFRVRHRSTAYSRLRSPTEGS
jgi:mRNA-degrading endonuclease RelE of RelBE toxin-antitoxin system